MYLKRIRKTHVRQHDESDCGVACLLSVIRYYGGDESLQHLRELSGTSRQGTTLLGLYQVALQTGFEAEGCEADLPSLIAHGHPVILHLVPEGKYQHYVVCYGYADNRFIVGDPAEGIVFYSPGELEKVWISHACLTLSPAAGFITRKEIGARKREWLIEMLKSDYGILGTSLAVGSVIAVLGMVTAVFSQKLIDVILPEKNIPRLVAGLALVFALLLARLGLSALRQFMLFTQSRDFNNRIIAFFYNKLLRLPRSFFDTRKTGELVARLNDTRRIQQVIGNIAGNIITDALVTIAALALLFYYSPPIAGLLVAGIPGFVYCVSRYNRTLIRAQRRVMAGYAKSESNFIHTMQGIHSIKHLNRQTEFGQLNRAVYGSFQDEVFRLGKINIRLAFLSGVISLSLMIAAIGAGSYYVLNDVLKVGELMAVISLATTITPSIVNLALVTIPLNEAKVAFNRMFEFIHIRPENEEGISPGDPIESIRIENLSFRFPGRKRILESISLSACRNQMTFIIGESGCGKSTLCHLLSKSYPPETGRILLNDGLDLQATALSAWRGLTGVVPQDAFIFNGTVWDNICLGVPATDPKAIQTVCRSWGFDRYISQLPQGYGTIVGEEGINLSGGQKQLIALARVLVQDPAVLILDEPTSSMDREMEKFTLNLLSDLKKKKIIIFISHRLHILKRYADRIYLIENGRITGSGTHEKMLLTDNLYSSFWFEYSKNNK